jgi:hypothetical protein
MQVTVAQVLREVVHRLATNLSPTPVDKCDGYRDQNP